MLNCYTLKVSQSMGDAISSVGTNGKSTGDICGAGVQLQEPCRALMADLRSTKVVRHLSHVMTRE